MSTDHPKPHQEFEDRFRELFRRYFGAVTHYFERQGFSREESADLAQEAFLNAYRGLDRFREDGPLQTWLFTIAKNVGANALRHRKAQKRDAQEVSLASQNTEADRAGSSAASGDESTVEQTLSDEEVPNPLESILSQEKAAQLRAAVDSLPPRMRQCVLLHSGQGLKYREIAALLRISPQTVGSQIAEARKRLGSALGNAFSSLDSDP